MKFYNRENELNYLNSLNKKSYDLIVLSGRRRVGKTELIKRINKIDFFFYVSEENSSSLLKSFTNDIKFYFQDEFLNFENWDIFLKFLFEKSKKIPLTIVFDEFQNFKKVDPSFFSILQKYIDNADFENIPINIICTGSYINMIKDLFNKSSSSLYGRKTGEILLKPLEFKYIYLLLNNLKVRNLEEIIKIYSLFGGMPRYYKLISDLDEVNFNNILNKKIFTSTSALSQEIKEVFFENILKTKKEYISILKAISLGNNTNKKISDFTKIENTTLPTYLSELINIYEVVRREVPITDDELKSKKGIYKLNDNLLLFWFRFIEKNRSYFEIGKFDFIKENIKINFNDFVGKNIFEDLAKQYIWKKYPKNLTGSWWSGETEIDVVSYDNKKEFILGEVKWTKEKVGFKLYNDLNEKIKKLKPVKVKKIYLFSKSGFEKNLIEKQDELNLELIDLKKMVDFLVE